MPTPAPARRRRLRTFVVTIAVTLAAGAGHRFGGSHVSALSRTPEAVPAVPAVLVHDAIHVLDVAALGAAGSSGQVEVQNGPNIPSGWAHDGSLIYVGRHEGRAAIFALRPATHAAQVVLSRDGIEGPARVTPDGQSILFLAEPALLSSQRRILRLPVGGGDPEPVVSGHFIDGGARCAVAPAMLCAIAERHDDGRHVIFSALNPMSGRGQELARVDGRDFTDVRWALSPDGTRIAVADARGSHIRILLIGGPAAESIKVSGQYGINEISFTSDSRGVIVPSVDALRASLWSIALHGSPQLLWEHPGAVEIAGLPSPDGRQMAVRVRTQAVARR